MGRDAAKEWKQFKDWAWTGGASLIGLLTGALVWGWVSHADKQFLAHGNRLDAHDTIFYKNENRLATMEADHKRLLQDNADMAQRIREFCRETRKC